MEKAEAAKLYRRIVQKAEATPEALLLGIQRYGAEVAHREERYIAYPSTWLSRGRWADEPAKPIGVTIDNTGNPCTPLSTSKSRTPSWDDAGWAGFQNGGRP